MAGAVLALASLQPVWSREPVGSVEDIRKLEAKIEAVAAKAMKSTVALISEESGASGSGVIVTADGLILTAAHVIEGAEAVTVVFPDGKQVKGKVLGANLSKDIGMVQMEDKGPWPFMERGESGPLEAGDWVIAMGHSTGFDPARTPPVRFGSVVSDGPGNFLTTDCTLIGGDSGGPLFDLDGKVVGINSSIGVSLKNNNHAGVDGFKEDWKRLIDGEVWGRLQMDPMANSERAVMGIELGGPVRGGGIVIAGVSEHASKAGLRPNDILVTVEGNKVRDGRALQLYLAKKQAGEKVKVGVLRGGNEKPVELEIELKQRNQIR
ncbi:S1C family serine protease [Luteolibacter flavescens]|uniref:S1C family serine protease n=1 Tax=Luteolibacter flavescens TaxID=1859460 RepID=A0ABT3FRQ1_9BACT|nr:S1C family serine protease [Luteolibacter flavescens]MCW1886257.1 S1C family serine protease [Luteolibacter flavescens]